MSVSTSLNLSSILSVASGGSILSLLSTLTASYSILDADTSTDAISPDSIVRVDFHAEANICTAPVEANTSTSTTAGYVAFNKIALPGTIRVVCTFEGWTGYSGAIPNLTNLTTTSRTDFIQKMESMRTSAALYDIVTPDDTYEDYDLISYNYAADGNTMLKAELIFQHVDTTLAVTLSSSTTGTCTVSTNAATKDAEESSISSAWSSLKGSVSSAYRSATSAVSSATSTVTSSITSAASSVTSSISSASSSLSSSTKSLIGNLV